MCGIIFAKRLDLKLASKLISKRYDKQKMRGRQGFGFIEINDGVVGKEFRTEGETDMLSFLSDNKCDEILFHHRFPTSTPNFIEATHPIKVSNKNLKYDYYVVHNGIINNDDELKLKHNEQGYKYTTEICKQYITSGNTYVESMWNDSEALAIDLAQAIETGKEIEADGSIAFIALQFDKKNNKAVALYFGRNDRNPLKMELSNEIFCLSSESGKEIKANKLNKYDYETGLFSSIDKNIGKKWVQTNNYQSNNFGFKYDGKDKLIDKEDFTYKYDDDDIELLENRTTKDVEIYYQTLQDLYDDIELLRCDIEDAKADKNFEELTELQFELDDKEDKLQTLINSDYE